MMRNRLKGMGVAMVTPFTITGDVDYVALDRMVDEHLASGTDFLCVLGTTAETPTLTKEEKRNIRKRIIEKVAGIKCGFKSTSCPDQLAAALIEYKESAN